MTSATVAPTVGRAGVVPGLLAVRGYPGRGQGKKRVAPSIVWVTPPPRMVSALSPLSPAPITDGSRPGTSWNTR